MFLTSNRLRTDKGHDSLSIANRHRQTGTLLQTGIKGDELMRSTCLCVEWFESMILDVSRSKQFRRETALDTNTLTVSIQMGYLTGQEEAGALEKFEPFIVDAAGVDSLAAQS